MNPRMISDSEVGILQGSGETFDRIRSRATRLVKAMARKFAGEPVGGISGVTVEETDDARILARVHTPVGEGRMRLGFKSSGEDTWGEVVVERQMFDARDRVYWEPVLNIHVPQQGNWTVGAEAPLLRHLSDDQQLFMLGATMLFVVMNGPQQ